MYITGSQTVQYRCFICYCSNWPSMIFYRRGVYFVDGAIKESAWRKQLVVHVRSFITCKGQKDNVKLVFLPISLWFVSAVVAGNKDVHRCQCCRRLLVVYYR